MIALPVWLTWKAVGGVFGSIWSGFCTFVATPIGAAILAAVIAYNSGVHIERSRLNATWQAKWDAAEAQAELDRLARDKLMKATVQADADKRINHLSSAKDILAAKLKEYEDDEARRAGSADGTPAGKTVGGLCPCLTDRSDDQWLLDARKAIAQPEARRGLAERLRAGSR